MLDMTARVAMEAAGAGAAAVMKEAPDVVMPTEEISESVAKILVDHGFDESLVRQSMRNKAQGE